MYFVIVIATTIVLPIGSALAEMMSLNLAGVHMPSSTILIVFLGKWYVFWAGGVRLLLAGARQTFMPGMTLTQIFEIDHKPSEHIVQELGFANLSIGLLCVTTLVLPILTPAGAMTAGLFYGLAGIQHVLKPGRNAQRTLAMATDLLVFAVLATYFVMFAGTQLG